MASPQAHRATAFHFLISNRFGFFVDDDGPAALLDPSPTGTMLTSVSRDAISGQSIESGQDRRESKRERNREERERGNREREQESLWREGETEEYFIEKGSDNFTRVGYVSDRGESRRELLTEHTTYPGHPFSRMSTPPLGFHREPTTFSPNTLCYLLP